MADVLRGRSDQRTSAGYRKHRALIKTEKLTSCTVIKKNTLSWCDPTFRRESIHTHFSTLIYSYQLPLMHKPSCFTSYWVRQAACFICYKVVTVTALCTVSVVLGDIWSVSTHVFSLWDQVKEWWDKPQLFFYQQQQSQLSLEETSKHHTVKHHMLIGALLNAPIRAGSTGPCLVNL